MKDISKDSDSLKIAPANTDSDSPKTAPVNQNTSDLTSSMANNGIRKRMGTYGSAPPIYSAINSVTNGSASVSIPRVRPSLKVNKPIQYESSPHKEENKSQKGDIPNVSLLPEQISFSHAISAPGRARSATPSNSIINRLSSTQPISQSPSSRPNTPTRRGSVPATKNEQAQIEKEETQKKLEKFREIIIGQDKFIPIKAISYFSLLTRHKHVFKYFQYRSALFLRDQPPTSCWVLMFGGTAGTALLVSNFTVISHFMSGLQTPYKFAFTFMVESSLGIIGNGLRPWLTKEYKPYAYNVKIKLAKLNNYAADISKDSISLLREIILSLTIYSNIFSPPTANNFLNIFYYTALCLGCGYLLYDRSRNFLNLVNISRNLSANENDIYAESRKIEIEGGVLSEEGKNKIDEILDRKTKLKEDSRKLELTLQFNKYCLALIPQVISDFFIPDIPYLTGLTRCLLPLATTYLRISNIIDTILNPEAYVACAKLDKIVEQESSKASNHQVAERG